MFESVWFLRAAVAAGGLAVLALEAGWTTTEVGRQPWMVYGVMRVEDAVTTNTGIWISLVAMVVVYLAWHHRRAGAARHGSTVARRHPPVDLPTPYGPGGELVAARRGSGGGS